MRFANQVSHVNQVKRLTVALSHFPNTLKTLKTLTSLIPFFAIIPLVKLHLPVLLSLLALSLRAADPWETAPANAFRVTPYVQHPATDAMSLLFLAQTDGPARVTWWAEGGSATNTLDFAAPRLAEELGYIKACSWLGSSDDSDLKSRSGAWEMPYTTPWQYAIRLTGLTPDTRYGYRVELKGAEYSNAFRTVPQKWRDIRFIYFSDSETEPDDNDPVKGLTPDWTDPANHDAKRNYYVTQTDCYAANLRTAMARGTELIVMAGDLAQKGSKQVCWDEFWRHNAGPLNDPAGSIPILASPGNHDYWEYRDNGNTGIDKYLSYFEFEPNDVPETELPDPRHRELFHRLDYGPATFIFLDLNNGLDGQPEDDTNDALWRDPANYPSGYRGHDLRPCPAPDFHPGSPMYAWLERQLQDAAKRSPFIFVVSHHCPYSVGYHCRDVGTDGQCAVPLRKDIVPLLQKYGVTAMLCGHDEMMEHSKVGDLHVWDMGIAGDGLRGGIIAQHGNPWQVWRADVDSPEQWNGPELVDGGKHYGHLEVSITQTANGEWQARFEPVYVFPKQDANGKFTGEFERRVYDDVLTITKGDPSKAVTPESYVATAKPGAFLMTFADGPDTRGFAWHTDDTVTETDLRLVTGEHGAGEDALFAAAPRIDGTCVDCSEGPVKIYHHKAQATGLTPGETYSYRVGGAGEYLYGTFTVKGAGSRSDEDVASPLSGQPNGEATSSSLQKKIQILYASDAQLRFIDLLPVWQNTIARASTLVGGAKALDFFLSGGDVFDVNYCCLDGDRNKYLNHPVYGPFEIYAYNYWKWGLDVDAVTPYLEGVPWVLSSGNHDGEYNGQVYYLNTTAVNWSPERCHSFDYGDVHFAILPCLATGDNAALYKDVVKWLDSDLKANLGKTKWTVVSVHWGPYTTGDHGINAQTQALVEMIAPVISAGHVDLVLQAHDHTFSKTLPYRWDTCGYTTVRENGEIVNLAPKTRRIRGELFDVNPQGTYYVTTGCAGHRFGEDGDTYAGIDGAQSYDKKRTYKVAAGKLAVDSRWGNRGDDASSNPAASMFGVLRFEGDEMTYDWYLVDPNGLTPAEHYDSLRVTKGEPGGALLWLE